MSNSRVKLALLMLSLLLLGTGVVPASSLTLPSQITVHMYRLDSYYGDKYQPEETCSAGNRNFGCAVNSSYTYPYPTNPATVPLETDYLMDVVPCEMDPYNFPNLSALQAQAIAARTYAYFHIQEGSTINNSRDFQVFVPYKFESLPYGQQNLIGLAVTPHGRYLSRSDNDQPTFIMYFDDIPERTKKEPDGAIHLWDVPDPISTACDAYTRTKNGYGMSQRGANRWARGQECSFDGAPVAPDNQAGGPWRVTWNCPEQILAHYYRAVEFRGFSPSVPSFHRWNVLDHDIPAMMMVDETRPVGMWVQNTSVDTWEFRPQDVKLPQIKCTWYRENGTSAGLGSTYALTESVAPSETDVYWFYLTSPATPGPYFLRCDMGRDEYDHELSAWIWKSFYDSGDGWPRLEKTVYVFSALYHLHLPLVLRGFPGD